MRRKPRCCGVSRRFDARRRAGDFRRVISDDLIASFTVEGAPLRGRIARLGAGAIDPILRRHAYPDPVALLLGEALLFASLMGSLVKVEGRLIVQAQGDGLVPLMVAEHREGGALRGYARLAPDAREKLAHAHRLAPRDLIGAGALAVTFDQGLGYAPHQGVVPLEGDTLAACAEAYFRDSEQTETRLKLAVGEVLSAHAPPMWRGGGALLQKVAPDDARGATEEGWSRATIFFDTLTDAELLDPALPADRALYRLFHEDGVRMTEPEPLVDQCSCEEERLVAVLQRFRAEEIADLVEPDGAIHANCQFCARLYRIAPERLKAG